MTDDELTELILALQKIKGVGAKTIVKFLDLVNPEEILADYKKIYQLTRVNKRAKLDQVDYSTWKKWLTNAHELIGRTRELGIQVYNYQAEEYPINLRGLADFPVIIYVKGNAKALQTPAVGFIGTRRMTQLGYKMSQKMASEFAKDGYTIVSGLSVGTNTAAHNGALEVHGTTIAVLGQSLEQPIYPKENTKLAAEIIANGGALVSTYNLGTIVRKQLLAERDQWESGLADGLVVVETDDNGKTELALQAAFKQKRPVGMLDHRQCSKIDDVSTISQAVGNQFYIQQRKASPLWELKSLHQFETIMKDARQQFLKKSKYPRKEGEIRLF